MAVKLNIIADVKGQGQVKNLQSNINKLGTNAAIASKRMKQLEMAAARSRGTFAALGQTLKTGVVVGLAAVTFGIGKFVKDTFAAGKLTESLQVRFKLLFNSASEGAKAFAELNTFAGKVPFSLEAIAAASGNLAVISKDANELAKVLALTGNVAAATGLDFRQTAEQIQRAFAGGIAAADVFRERGVRAMLGFEAGVTVSVEETRKRFFEVFGNGGQFSTATKEFEQTLEAQVSFVEDAYFRFRQAAAKPLFAGVKKQVMDLVGNFKQNDAALKQLANTVGNKMAAAFQSIQDTIVFVAKNITLLTKAFIIFIGLKIATFVAGIVAQFILLGTAIKGATFTLAALNLALRANIVGIVITAVQLAVVAFIAFNDEVMALVNTVKNFLIVTLKKAELATLSFISKLTIFPETSKTAAEAAMKLRQELELIRLNANEVVDSFAKLTVKQKELFSGTRRRPRAERDQSSRPNSDAADIAAKALKVRQAELASINERIMFTNKRMIIDQAKANGLLLDYRQLLERAGIEATLISDTISTSWIEGLRAGNSLLEVTKSMFRNLLQTITETIFKKGVELAVEKLFQIFAQKKVGLEKQVTQEKQKQLALQIAIMAAGGGGGGGFKFFGMSKGGVVPGGAPYTDRVPTMLTPGEVVIPRGGNGSGSSVSNTTINISGNVDQRAIDQIRNVISSSPTHVGGANKNFTRDTAGIRNRGR